MPLIEGYISELTDQLAVRLEQDITSAVTEALAQAFPLELGFAPGSQEYQVGLEIARKIMPGWIWVALSQQKWAIRGKRNENAIAARIHILVLQNALEPQYKDRILEAVTHRKRYPGYTWQTSPSCRFDHRRRCGYVASKGTVQGPDAWSSRGGLAGKKC